jgi:hypothetical protein
MNGFLYIDPGTGSMLFSVIIGIVSTLFFVMKSVLVKVRFFFAGKSARVAESRRHAYVIFCEGKQYWNVFKPVIDEFERREIAVRYLTTNEDDPVLSAGYRFVSAEYIGSGNHAFTRLNMLEADVCLMTTPGLDVYQLKRSKGVRHYSHVLHSVDDATSYRLFGLDYFDSVLLSGEYQKDHVRKLERLRGLPAKDLVVVGSTYLDVLESRISTIPAENADGSEKPFTVLVAPSWGAGAILSRYGEKLLDPLVATGFRIIIRPHPQSRSSETAVLDRLMARYKDKANVEWDAERENIYALSKADVMISDFSSVVFDFVFLFDRPVMYANSNLDLRPYDASDIPEEPWKFRVLKEIGLELTEDKFTNIGDEVRAAAKSQALKENRTRARETAWEFRGQAGARIVDYLVETRDALHVTLNNQDAATRD